MQRNEHSRPVGFLYKDLTAVNPVSDEQNTNVCFIERFSGLAQGLLQYRAQAKQVVP